MKVTRDKGSKEETKKMMQHPSFYNHDRTTNKANSVGIVHKFNINILLNPQPSIHLLVSKTSWRCLEDMSWKTNWRCLHCNYLSLTIKLYKQWFKSKHSSFFKEIHRVIMRNLSFVMNLQCKHNYFYTLVTPNESDQRQRKQRRNEENDATPIILQSCQNN